VYTQKSPVIRDSYAGIPSRHVSKMAFVALERAKEVIASPSGFKFVAQVFFLCFRQFPSFIIVVFVGWVIRPFPGDEAYRKAPVVKRSVATSMPSSLAWAPVPSTVPKICANNP